MTEGLIELIKLLGNMPAASLWALTIFLIYKAILYLSCSSVIAYLGKLLIGVINNHLINVRMERKDSKLYYHALIRENCSYKDKAKTEWMYNRESLDQFSQYGVILEFYTSTDKVAGF